MKITLEDVSTHDIVQLLQYLKPDETPTAASTDQNSSRAMLSKLSSAFHDALNGNKIGAIKTIRELNQCPLKEAKDVVEGNFQ